MIIPTPEFDPLFADDGVPFREKMCRYIEDQFADLILQHADARSLLQESQRTPAPRTPAVGKRAWKCLAESCPDGLPLSPLPSASVELTETL